MSFSKDPSSQKDDKEEHDVCDKPFPDALLADRVTILAYGALLSERSSRLTFPHLQDFRHVRIHGMRRVFAHPHIFLLQKQLLDPQDGENRLCLASLSAEVEPKSSFIAAAFAVQLDDEQRRAFVEREKEYKIISVPYHELITAAQTSPDGEAPRALSSGMMGVLCVAARDDDIDVLPPTNLPFNSIWHWPRDSGLLPADLYLRHCILAVQKCGNPTAEQSFYQDTYLVDRTTTLAEYLATGNNQERVMACLPPSDLATRFGG